MEIEEYKNNPLFPFVDFRNNDASFMMLELFWTDLVRETLGEELSQKCVPLQDIERDNGEEYFHDPVMIDFWIPEMRRGVRVSLLENYENLPNFTNDTKGDGRFNSYHGFTAYWQKRGITGPDDKIEQVVFRSDMSDHALNLVQIGLQKFLLKKLSREEFEKWVDDYHHALGHPSQEEWDDYYDRISEDG